MKEKNIINNKIRLTTGKYKIKSILEDESLTLLNDYNSFYNYWIEEHKDSGDFNLLIYEICKDELDIEYIFLKKSDFDKIECLRKERAIFLSKTLPKIYNNLKKEYLKLSKNEIRIYRYIGIDDLDVFIKSLKKGTLIKDYIGIGTNWTRWEDYIYLYSERNYGDINLFLTALVNKDDINWNTTLIKNTTIGFGIGINKDAEVEEEIILKKGRKIKLISIIKETDKGIEKIDIEKLFGNKFIETNS